MFPEIPVWIESGYLAKPCAIQQLFQIYLLAWCKAATVFKKVNQAWMVFLGGVDLDHAQY